MQKNAFSLVFVPATLLLLSLSAGSAQDNATFASAPQVTLPAETAPVQSKNWRNEIGTFKIGLVRGWSSDMSRVALARLEGVFAKALGTPVRVVVFERFTSLMDAQADGRIDLAAYSARAYATIRLMCECVDAIATPSTLEGATGQISVLAGDKLRMSSTSATATAKIGRVTTAQIANQEMLRGNLVINGKSVTGKEGFWVDFENYESVVKAYQNNEIDAFLLPVPTDFNNRVTAGKSELDRLMQTQNSNPQRPAIALWRSTFWPYGPVALRRNIAGEAKSIVLNTLKQLDATAPGPHSVLADGLSGAFLDVDQRGYANAELSIQLLISQNAN